MSEDHGTSEGEDDGPLLQKIEASFLKSGGMASDAVEGSDGQGGGDLFSEIHLNEVKKLERQLEQLETEKNALFQRLRDAQETAENVRLEAATRHIQLSKLDAYLASLLHLHETLDISSSSVVSLDFFFSKLKKNFAMFYSLIFFISIIIILGNWHFR